MVLYMSISSIWGFDHFFFLGWKPSTVLPSWILSSCLPTKLRNCCIFSLLMRTVLSKPHLKAFRIFFVFLFGILRFGGKRV